MTVDEAKSWFDANQPEFLVLKSGGMSKNTKVIKPSWKGAYASKNRKVEVVETHIMTNGAFGFATEDTYKEWLATDNSSYLTSLSRIVVMRYKDTEEIVSFIMTIVGDKEYLKKKNFKLWDNDYTVKDDDFSGLVLYHSLEGKFVNGWRYTDGEVTHKVKLDFDTDIRLKLKSGHYECTTYNIYEMFVECTYLGITGEYGLLSCSNDITYEYVGSVNECVYVSDDNSSGGTYEPNEDCNYANSINVNCSELLSFESDYKNRMSISERDIFDSMTRHQQLSYLGNAYQASIEAENNYPANSLYNGKGDAFRHAYWNAKYSTPQN